MLLGLSVVMLDAAVLEMELILRADVDRKAEGLSTLECVLWEEGRVDEDRCAVSAPGRASAPSLIEFIDGCRFAVAVVGGLSSDGLLSAAAGFVVLASLGSGMLRSDVERSMILLLRLTMPDRGIIVSWDSTASFELPPRWAVALPPSFDSPPAGAAARVGERFSANVFPTPSALAEPSSFLMANGVGSLLCLFGVLLAKGLSGLGRPSCNRLADGRCV